MQEYEIIPTMDELHRVWEKTKLFDKLDKLTSKMPSNFDHIEYGELCNLYAKLLKETALTKNKAIGLKDSYSIEKAKMTLLLKEEKTEDGKKKHTDTTMEATITIELEKEKQCYLNEEFAYNILDARAKGIFVIITAVRDSLKQWEVQSWWIE